MWASGTKPADATAVGFDSKVRLSRSADQSIPGVTWTNVAWDVADYDGLSEFDSDNNRIVVAATGTYTLKYCIVWYNAIAADWTYAEPQVNGATITPCSGKPGDVSGEHTKNNGSIDLALTAGDLVTLRVYTSKAGGLNLQYLSDGGTRLSLRRAA